MADIRTVGWEVTKFVIAGAMGFGGGCLAGYLAKSPVLIMTGGVYAIFAVAQHGLKFLVESLAKKHAWNLSTVKFLDAASSAVFAAAMIVTSVALGILNPVGAAVLGGSAFIMSGVFVGVGLYRKFSGEDLPYLKYLNRATT